ncbi:DNA cytosine methyltransferase [Microbacterium maritypicum]|uniref:DNA cytosine methyltransferase n=1 Tax=Microbacterium maritypicum TaxID=33918 RepID=UPI0026719346|nr:DNA cytosine methyltransferase [Microbacterium liquefaciens]WKT90693.1 DNA cytosine methyltransferase [Microbacterium liquefaciens]
MTKNLRMIDLFAGCGGMTVGFASEGFKPVLAVEWDRAAAATYAANFGEDHVIAGDIAAVPDEVIPEADIVIGGPPCQGFSNLGLKDINDPRNQLWREFMRFVKHARPKVFVIENVDRFAKSPEFAMLLAEADHGALVEYELQHAVLNAADYGVAQRRKRTIVIGSRIGRIELPAATHAKEPATGSGLLPWRTVRDVIGDIPPHPSTTELPARTSEIFGDPMPGVFRGLDLHIRRTPTSKSLDRYSFVPPGGGRFDLPAALLPNCWANKPTGTTDVMGRLRWDMPSVTIRTEFFKPEKGQYLHPQWEAGDWVEEYGKHRSDPVRSVDRVISHFEASLIQDFPSDYRWVGTKIQIARQIGNAVPSGLARAIAQQIKPHLLTVGASDARELSAA